MIETIFSPISVIVALYSALSLIVWTACKLGQVSCTQNFPYIPILILLISESLRRLAKRKTLPTQEYNWKKKFFIRLVVLITINILPLIAVFSSPYGGFAIPALVLFDVCILIYIVANAMEDYKKRVRIGSKNGSDAPIQ